jgi:hypothetical protein
VPAAASWTPPASPSDQEFRAQLRRLEGVPAEVLEHDGLMRVPLPVLRAYGGAADPNVREDGGHLYLNATPDFLAALAGDLEAIC